MPIAEAVRRGSIMLTGKLVRVRYARDRVIPQYLDASDPTWLEAADRLLDLFRVQGGRTRGCLQEELRELVGTDPSQLVHQGLAKLLEDRCEFEVISGHPPEKIREVAFRTAAAHRAREWERERVIVWESESVRASERSGVEAESFAPPLSDSPTISLSHALTPFNRRAVLQEVADSLGLTPESVEQGLFADLKSEQRLVKFKDITAERLLQRYNVALAQALLLRSTRVEVQIRGESPQRYRQLFRLVKFHRLVCQIELAGSDSYRLQLDGPLSLFAATLKYGLQLALFLPAILLCRDFELRAELSWGPQRKPKSFTLSSADGLVSHYADTGTYVPPEMRMFVELFRKKINDWEIAQETSVFRLGDGLSPGASA
jgi:predicted nuclease of restriction endonuclease-like RecB superfamily